MERTDHIHLGQLLTSAAGLNTVTIIWIAKHFADEHRAALDWLNEITGDEISFFGLEKFRTVFGSKIKSIDPGDWQPEDVGDE